MLNRTNALVLMAIMALGCGGEAGQDEAAATEEAAPAAVEAAAPEAAGAEGATEAMISEGQSLFAGAGLCTACHGANGSGIPNLGANLTDDEWLHGDGSLDGIYQTIMAGVTADKSTTGTVMPPKGGSALTDEQVRSVAAYVFSLSN